MDIGILIIIIITVADCEFNMEARYNLMMGALSYRILQN